MDGTRRSPGLCGMPSRGWPARPALILVLALACGGPGRDLDAIRQDYAASWSALVQFDIQDNVKELQVGRSVELHRAWELIGEFAVAYLRRHPRATTADVREAVRSLDPIDPVAVCKPSVLDPEAFPIFCELAHFGIGADVLELEPPPHAAFAIALSYGYFGRLLIVSANRVAASEEIHRRGTLIPIATGPGEGTRFAVKCDGEDWPTSFCGTSELSLWSWDARDVHRLTQRSVGYPRDRDRFNRLYRHGRWLKMYARGARRFFWCCACTDPAQLWKFRLDPTGVRDFGPRVLDRTLAVVDRLLDRVLRGRDVHELATATATDRLAYLLAGLPEPTTWDSYDVASQDARHTRLIARDYGLLWSSPSLVFELERRRGRLVVVDARLASASESSGRP